MRPLFLPILLATTTSLPALEFPLVDAVLTHVIDLIRPELQPNDYFERATAVVILSVTAVDDAKNTVELKVVQVCKGDFAPRTVTMTVVGAQPQEAFVKLMSTGVTVTAFIGVARKPLQLLFYAGGEGTWQMGSLAGKEDPGHWNWTEDLKQLGPQSLFGTFNGSDTRFAEMMGDMAAGRYYFHAKPIDKFKEDQTIGTLPGPVRGVALYDIDGDGRLDVYACSPEGDRLYQQSAPGAFTDRTSEYGLAGTRSRSVNLADMNGDGLADLLLDGTLWMQGADHRFTRSENLGPVAGKDVLSALLSDVDGDGYPDVVVSHRAGGLTLHLNPGATGGAFLDATARAGLDQAACGAGSTGWIMAGDWTGDHRPTLFYATQGGLLLTRNDAGRFAPNGPALNYDFNAEGTTSGLTGAGCFAPVWKSDRQDLLFTRDTGFAIAINAGTEKPLDGIQFGNELQLSSIDQLPLIAEDLNADGTIDIYLGSRGGKPNMYYVNRGYGSYMIPDRYDPKVFAGLAHKRGAWGLAAGDVNGDGANDLLIGGVDGALTLLVNNCLAARIPSEHPTAVERILSATRILSVRVAGPLGVVGATVTIRSADGRVLGRRDIGSNVATGCRSPDTVNLAVREQGMHSLTVRWSDGVIRRWTLAMGAEAAPVQHLTAERTGGQAP